MSVVAAAIVTGLIVLVLVKTKWVRPSGAIVCVIFGLVLGATPMGPIVNDVLTAMGQWALAQLRAV